MSIPKPDGNTLRLGSTAPNFQADTSNGPIDFYDFAGDNWVVLFSHPDDFTPVCTTELGAFAKLQPEFEKRGVKLIGLSANGTESHKSWIKDIDEITGSNLKFPIIADPKREIAYKYDMIDYQDATNVDNKASTGRNTAEVLRVVDSLQLGDKNRITTPINWVPGDDVIVHPSVSNDEAKTLFPKFRIVKPYLRLTPLAVDQK
ncbi:unnamed protein product [Wickerhamomyces anomalus]